MIYMTVRFAASELWSPASSQYGTGPNISIKKSRKAQTLGDRCLPLG